MAKRATKKVDAAERIAEWLDTCEVERVISNPEKIGQVLSSNDQKRLMKRIRRAISAGRKKRSNQ